MLVDARDSKNQDQDDSMAKAIPYICDPSASFYLVSAAAPNCTANDACMDIADAAKLHKHGFQDGTSGGFDDMAEGSNDYPTTIDPCRGASALRVPSERDRSLSGFVEKRGIEFSFLVICQIVFFTW